MTYTSRIIDTELRDLLDGLPAVAIEGAKGVGKTSTARRLAASEFMVSQRAVVENLNGDPRSILGSPAPRLLDEWQREPWLWDEVRIWVDEDYSPGQFILTGSSAPSHTPLHSGAGRIVSLRMRPLSLDERWSCSSISLKSLLDGSVESVHGSCSARLADYIHEIAASGFPGFRSLSERSNRRALDGYLDAIVKKEFPEMGLLVRKPDSLKAWLNAYALATGGTASYASILDAATPGDGDKPSQKTTVTYRDTLAALWVTDPVPAWQPVLSGLPVPLAKGAKHFLADPALAVRLLDLTEGDLLLANTPDPIGGPVGTLVGRLFEAIVALSLHVYAQSADARVAHLRTANTNREIDFIVERGTHVLAIEVKMANSITGRDVRHLNWLEESLTRRHITKVCLTTGDTAYTRRDGVHVIPAGLLGP